MEKPAAAKPAATSKAAAAPKAKAESVTLKQIAVELAKKHELSNKATGALLDDFVVVITKQLKRGARIRLTGLGILSVRKRAARMGRNPATGEAIKIKASKKVSFRASKELKEAV
jgi:DNA-binding protein HU-beta